MTTKNETVTLSAEVSAAIERALNSLDGGKSELIELHTMPGCAWGGEYIALNQIDLLTLASALINGYQVEKSPEEKLREYYEILKEGSCADVARSTQRSFHDTMEGVIKTLKILGITIEGINA